MIISQQKWEGLWVSKHHYASELAEKGNTVFFLDPPVLSKSSGKSSVEIIPSSIHDSLFIIRDHISFTYEIKFHFPWLFYLLIKPHVAEIMRLIGRPIDIVWSFDLSNVYPLRYFTKAALRIFHSVDTPHNPSGIEAAKGADFIFSTSPEILEKYKGYSVPLGFINHGLSDTFLSCFSHGKSDGKIHFGYSGNLLRHDIDRECLISIIKANKNVIFEFWGAFSSGNDNFGRKEGRATADFIKALKSYQNVVLHGPVPYLQLPAEFSRMDGFLICYNVLAKNAIGPNYHKLMEYLSSGKVIISSFVGLYSGRPDLIQMVSEQTNEKLSELFSVVLNDLDFHNSPERQEKRIAFARENTYKKQLDRIECFLSENSF